MYLNQFDVNKIILNMYYGFIQIQNILYLNKIIFDLYDITSGWWYIIYYIIIYSNIMLDVIIYYRFL